jgi:hypothetical protein
MPIMNDADLARWYRTPGDPDVFEDIAEWFQRETGHLRPGKDPAPGSGHTYECCHDAWAEWSEQKHGEAVRGLLAQRNRYLEALVPIAAEGCRNEDVGDDAPPPGCVCPACRASHALNPE